MIQEAAEKALDLGRQFIEQGEVASYIPELAKGDKSKLGVCILTMDGERYAAGDFEDRFTIQSISKVITLAVALQTKGFDTVFDKVQMEPSGDAFNSIVKLDLSSDHPYNPLINSGAIAVSSFLQADYDFSDLLEWSRSLCLDPGITLDKNVYRSEAATGSRNRSIAYLLKSKGILQGDVDGCLDLYFRMCSLRVTAESLAGFGLVLANDGIDPRSGRQLLDTQVVRVVKTLMLTCGMYDGSGEFAVRVGMPSKSGVGGGIMSCVEGKLGIGTFGPALDTKGNSIGGRRILEDLSRELHLHIFDPKTLV